MTVIDTHTHIYLPEFEGDREQMLERAEAENVAKILLPAIDHACHQDLFSLENKHPETCLAMMGLHPCSVKEDFKEQLKIAREWLDKREFAGIGEIGLDFYWDLSFTKEQYDSLNIQLQWAKEFDLPFSLHSRNAVDECIEVTAAHQDGKLKGVFHCFSGTAEQAKKIIELGFFLGIGGVVTFKNSGLDKAIEDISLDHIVLETDAPYLAPVPFRGKRNEPSYLKYVVQKMATIKNIAEDEVRKITTSNAEKLFRCPPAP